MPKTKIPDNWLYCPQIAEVAIESVVPLKVPLDSKYQNKYPKKNEWSWEKALEHYPDIGLVVDLTNTDRYYDRQELYDRDIEYIKMRMPGHGQIPKQRQMDKLAGRINGFIEEHPGKQVGVHCTHGFNRTGFLVCAYLKLHKNYSIPMAVEAFAKNRQGGIYRTELIQALYEFYHDEKVTVAEVPKPAWHTKDKNWQPKNQSIEKAKNKEKPENPRMIVLPSSGSWRSSANSARNPEATFTSASRNPLGIQSSVLWGKEVEVLDEVDSKDTGVPVWIIPSRRKSSSKK